MARSAHARPTVGWLYSKLLALCFAVAWGSLAAQWRVLIGSQGLQPAASWLRTLQQVGLAQVPTVFWLNASDAALRAGIWLGLGVAMAAFLGLWPRWMFAVSTLLYLSYVSVGRTFFAFQWDSLLLECGALAVFLPVDRPSPGMHMLYRLLMFKLYFESGLAKWQSPFGDWLDGSAMTHYYETAPLPTFLAYHAHHLPRAWHLVESYAVLFIELVLPFVLFAPRLARMAAALGLTLFQTINIATANYGFFVPLALSLHVFVLDDDDVADVRDRLARLRLRTGLRRIGALLGRLLHPGRFLWRRSFVSETVSAAGLHLGHRLAVLAAASIFVVLSLCEGLEQFADLPVATAWLQGAHESWRLVNTYHLFSAITRDRIEAELQLFDGQSWHTYDLRHKPGDIHRAPDFVQPHQPRVDFQLWFHGLNPDGTPEYLAALLTHVCKQPKTVQGLFRAPLPAAPRAVRVVYWRYHFATLARHARGGDWWQRTYVGARPALACATLKALPPK